MGIQHCTRCGAASPDDALACQHCGHSFNKGTQQKKQRSFLAGLLLLLGIRRVPQTGLLGSTLIPAISVTLVAVIITGVIVGPVLKVIPPFASGLTVRGIVVRGGTVTIHGTNFPPGSNIEFTSDGINIVYCGEFIMVGRDGTFAGDASIPTSWLPGSKHVIKVQATGQDGRVLAQEQQTVTVSTEPEAIGQCR